MVQERTLQRGKRIGVAETLNRLDFRAFGLRGRDHARADLSAVHHDRTGTAIAGIAAGGAVGLALALGLCAGSVYLCRKMKREIKQANEFRAAAKPKPGAQDNGVELRPAD